jgi:8-oxo-dGTP pyrophosphatase MutT (NUDIX family)
MPTGAESEFSAGGVVVRDGRCIVIVPTRRAADGSKVLALPKGHPDGAESAADAALREVREETGVDATLVEKLGDIRYWYMRGGRRIAKVVSFFLLDLRRRRARGPRPRGRAGPVDGTRRGGAATHLQGRAGHGGGGDVTQGKTSVGC